MRPNARLRRLFPVNTAGLSARRPTTQHLTLQVGAPSPILSPFLELWLPHLHNVLSYLCLSLHRLCLEPNGLPTFLNLADFYLQMQLRLLSSTFGPRP